MRLAFASAPVQVIVLNVRANEPGRLHCKVSLDGPLQKAVSAPQSGRLLLTGKAAAHIAGAGHPGSEKPVVLSEAPGEGMNFASVLEVQASDGRVETRAAQIEIADASEMTILIAAATEYRGFQSMPDTPMDQVIAEARAQLDAAASRKFDELQERQVSDHQRLFRRISLRLGAPENNLNKPTDERLKEVGNSLDASLAALYFQYRRYLMISSSRPRSQPANLQGIWNRQVTPSWSSNWTSNINLQMNYWPAETCNLSEVAGLLFDLIQDLSVRRRQAARETYGLPGWLSHHNIDIWRAANPVGQGVGQPTWANWNMSGLWLCQHLFDHYLFTGDVEFLRDRAYAVMKGAAEFCLAFLIASKILGLDPDFSAKLQTASERLIPYQIGKGGARFT